MEPRYSSEPVDRPGYTAKHDRLYTRYARLYDVAVRSLPVWRRWLSSALPAIRGPRVLEVSFGTGWLLTRYAARFDVDGIDPNTALIAVARRNLARAGVRADLLQGWVESLPFPDATFDTVVCTMAFTGYPDGARAAAELARVIKPGGRLVMVDVNYPPNGNRLGTALVRCVWQHSGDIIRDVRSLLAAEGFDVEDEAVGGWGSVHRYVAAKPTM